MGGSQSASASAACSRSTLTRAASGLPGRTSPLRASLSGTLRSRAACLPLRSSRVDLRCLRILGARMLLGRVGAHGTWPLGVEAGRAVRLLGNPNQFKCSSAAASTRSRRHAAGDNAQHLSSARAFLLLFFVVVVLGLARRGPRRAGCKALEPFPCLRTPPDRRQKSHHTLLAIEGVSETSPSTPEPALSYF